MVRDLDNNYRQWGCPAAKEVLYITAYGDVCGCPFNHVKLGNVLEEPLSKILKRAHNTEWYGEYHQECLTAENKDFINLYLPLVGKKGMPDLADLLEADKQMEDSQKESHATD